MSADLRSLCSLGLASVGQSCARPQVGKRWGRRQRLEEAGKPVGPRREHRRDERQHEHVEADERADPLVEAGFEGECREDQRELAAGEHGQRDPRRGAGVVPVEPRRHDAGDGVEHERDDDGSQHRHDHLAGVGRVERQAEGEEEDGRERVAQRQHESFDAAVDDGDGDDRAGEEGADGVRDAELLGDAGGEDRHAEEGDRQQLVVGRVEQPADDAAAPT